jgi:hypothetical protein
MLMSADGQKFMQDCKREGKEVCAWTVNSKEEMVWCARWGIKAIITDRVAYCVNVRKEVSRKVLLCGAVSLTARGQWEEDPTKLEPPLLKKLIFPWSSWKYYSVPQVSLPHCASFAKLIWPLRRR